MRGLFLDFEATDKDVANARITQIAFSIYDIETKKELYHFSSLVKLPDGVSIHPDAAKITGLTKEQLDEFGQPAANILTHLCSFFPAVRYLVAHNLRRYDLLLLKNELARYGLPEPEYPEMIDTRYDIPWPSHIDTRKLTYLGAEFGIVNPSAHSARHDTDILAKLFFMHPLDKILERALSPTILVRADVSYEHREKAKSKKFYWDGEKKIWVKEFKKCDFEKEDFDFKTIILKNE